MAGAVGTDGLLRKTKLPKRKGPRMQFEAHALSAGIVCAVPSGAVPVLSSNRRGDISEELWEKGEATS